MLYYKCKDKGEARKGTSLCSSYLCVIGYLWYNVGKLFISNNKGNGRQRGNSGSNRFDYSNVEQLRSANQYAGTIGALPTRYTTKIEKKIEL